MNKSQIREIALANGFQLKKQPDGSEDLHPYVYEFVADVLQSARDYAASKIDPYDLAAKYDRAIFELARRIKEAA